MNEYILGKLGMAACVYELCWEGRDGRVPGAHTGQTAQLTR